jgi:hypothetical protein
MVVGAVHNVNRLHIFFKCINRSENTGNIINYMIVSTANTFFSGMLYSLLNNWLLTLIHFPQMLVTNYKRMLCNILNIENLSYKMVEA